MPEVIKTPFKSLSKAFFGFLFLAALAAGPAWAGAVSPIDLDRAAGGRTAADETATGRIVEYTEIVRQIHMKDPGMPATVIGCVIVTPGTGGGASPVTVPLIHGETPGSLLPVVRPNLTGSAWAGSEWTAVVDPDGLSASFETDAPGVYAVYNPARDARSWNASAYETFTTVPPVRREIRLLDIDEAWGLIPENAPSDGKIPLILVHGDNSYSVSKDRWGDFLDWVSDHPEFDSRYEIWRFHHDTTDLIGFDGRSGNARELGDAILSRFGPDRKILLLAHSRGGLVSRAYMTGYGERSEGDRVLGLVALATPHHGSPGAVPEWGLETIKDAFKDTALADILYGFDGDAAVNVADMGTMGLAWDNYDGPENGIPYIRFDLETDIGDSHTLSVLDANLSHPSLPASQADDTVYLPDRSFGTLEELNADTRYFGKIIAYGGYDTDLGVAGQLRFNWLDFSFQEHAGLEVATQLMANMQSRDADGGASRRLFMANDGMVPLQSAFLLKKDPAAEPMYEIEEDIDWFVLDSYEVHLKDFTSRLNFRKSFICEDFDHLHLVEGRGGVAHDESDYWDHVSRSLNELSTLSEEEARDFTPEAEVLHDIDGRPSLSAVVDGSNCFIGSLWNTGHPQTAAVPVAGILAALGVGLSVLGRPRRGMK